MLRNSIAGLKSFVLDFLGKSRWLSRNSVLEQEPQACLNVIHGIVPVDITGIPVVA